MATKTTRKSIDRRDHAVIFYRGDSVVVSPGREYICLCVKVSDHWVFDFHCGLACLDAYSFDLGLVGVVKVSWNHPWNTRRVLEGEANVRPDPQ